MSYAPVVMFVYNRADHFERTFRALAACREAKETDLIVYSDGPKNEDGTEKVLAVREKLREASREGAFQSVTVHESERNRGLAASIIAGVTEVMAQFGRAIVLEDDCVAHPAFLGYMNKCLAFYQNDMSVGSISGYTPRLTFPSDFHEDVFAAYRSCSWSWASWADRWENVDWEMKDIGRFYENKAYIKRLNANGSDRFLRLYRQTKGDGGSWSVRFGAHLAAKNMLTIYPRYSYIQNIGCDESGVHSQRGDAEKMRVDLSQAIQDPAPVPARIDDRIQRIMRRFYSDGLLSDCKRALATGAILAKERLSQNGRG